MAGHLTDKVEIGTGPAGSSYYADTLRVFSGNPFPISRARPLVRFLFFSRQIPCVCSQKEVLETPFIELVEYSGTIEGVIAL